MLTGSSKSFVQAAVVARPPSCSVALDLTVPGQCHMVKCMTACCMCSGILHYVLCTRWRAGTVAVLPVASAIHVRLWMAFKLGAEPGKCGMSKCSLSLFSQSCAAPNATSYSMPASELSLQRPACLSMSGLLNTSALSIAQTLYHPVTCNHNMVICLHVHHDWYTI